MSTVCAAVTPVNAVLPARRGQPSKQTGPRLRVVNRTLVQAALAGTALPSDADLARQLGIGERTVRTMRLQVLGLNRHELKGWRRTAVPTPVPEVTGQRELSQIVLEAVAELRRLRQHAGVKHAKHVRLILDRGAYKGSEFEKLWSDPHLSFIAMARVTKKNVAQWEALPEHSFRPSQSAGDANPNLKLARAQTTITGCKFPMPSVIIRDDTPDTKQRWRVLFFKDEPGRQMFREPNTDGEKRQTVATEETPRSQQDVRFVAWIKFLTFNLIKDFGVTLGKKFAPLQVATLVRRYLLRPGRLYLQAGQLIVQLEPFRGDEHLRAFIQRVNERRLSLPWLSNLVLQFEVAAQPQGLAAVPQRVGLKILANSGCPAPP